MLYSENRNNKSYHIEAEKLLHTTEEWLHQ